MEKKFAKGIKVKEIGKFGSLRMSINSADIFDKENNFNEASGWGNFIINKSKNGNWYVVVDEWKPNQENKEVVKFDKVDTQDLPF